MMKLGVSFMGCGDYAVYVCVGKKKKFVTPKAILLQC